MFNILLDYPSFEQEIDIVKNTTSEKIATASQVISAEEIAFFQQLVRKVPVADNVVEYAVKLVHNTRPGDPNAPKITQEYLEWGAGPRASQFLIIAAKCNCILAGKFSPDIEDVKMVAHATLRHRLVRNFKAEADGVSVDQLIDQLL